MNPHISEREFYGQQADSLVLVYQPTLKGTLWNLR